MRKISDNPVANGFIYGYVGDAWSVMWIIPKAREYTIWPPSSVQRAFWCHFESFWHCSRQFKSNAPFPKSKSRSWFPHIRNSRRGSQPYGTTSKIQVRFLFGHATSRPNNVLVAASAAVLLGGCNGSAGNRFEQFSEVAWAWKESTHHASKHWPCAWSETHSPCTEGPCTFAIQEVERSHQLDVWSALESFHWQGNKIEHRPVHTVDFGDPAFRPRAEA